MAFTDYDDEVYSAIKTYLAANWTDTSIAWPNEEVTNRGQNPFIVVDLHGTLFAQADMGEDNQADNRWDEEGVLWIYVLVARGRRFHNARGAAKAIAKLFRGITLLDGRLEFLEAAIGAGQSGDDDGSWFMTPISINWRLMEA